MSNNTVSGIIIGENFYPLSRRLSLDISILLQAIAFHYSHFLLSVPIQLGLGLLLAYRLYQNIRGKELFRVMFFLPYITSTLAPAAGV